MGLFSKKSVLGTMRFEFYGPNEVTVTRSIPDDLMCYFSFLSAAKFLVNFSGNTGREVAQLGRNRLEQIDDSRPLDWNSDLSPVCTQEPVNLSGVSNAEREVKKVSGQSYLARLCEKGDRFFVETKICFGREDHYHRVAIGVGLELARRDLGMNGGAVCAAAKGFFGVLADKGTSDLNLNYAYAMSASSLANQGEFGTEEPNEVNVFTLMQDHVNSVLDSAKSFSEYSLVKESPNKEKLLAEYLLLIAYSLDAGMCLVFGEDNRVNDLLDLLYEVLAHRWSLELLTERRKIYCDAYSKPHPEYGASYSVTMKFCEICEEHHIGLVMYVAKMFLNSVSQNKKAFEALFNAETH